MRGVGEDANPVQTTAIFGVEKGFRRDAVDADFLYYSIVTFLKKSFGCAPEGRSLPVVFTESIYNPRLRPVTVL
jgi:hypothetical protein